MAVGGGDGLARPGIRVERISRVRPSNVCADGAPEAGRVQIVVAKVVARTKLALVQVGGQDKRCPAGPASDQTCREIDLAIGSDRLDVCPESVDILTEGTQHQIAAVQA